MYYFLIGKAKDKISGPASPTYRDMLQNFLFYRWILGKSKKESAALVVKNAMIFWNNLNVETRKKDKIEQKLIKEFDDWHNGIYKYQKTQTGEQKRKRADFKLKLDTVFDVSKEKPKRPVHTVQFGSPDVGVPESKKMMKSASYEETFGRTRRSLPFHASSPTTSETNLSELTSPRTLRSQQFGESSSATTESTILTDFADLELGDIDYDDDDDDDIDNKDDDDDNDEYEDPNYETYYVNEQKKVKFIDNHVVTTIDAIGLSDYKAARLLTAVAQALGFALDDVTVSRNTIQRRRAENRKLIAEAVKKEFKVNLQSAPKGVVFVLIFYSMSYVGRIWCSALGWKIDGRHSWTWQS